MKRGARKLPPRPRWAHWLRAEEWSHLCEVARDIYGKQIPARADVRENATTCPTCEGIARKCGIKLVGETDVSRETSKEM